MIENGLWSATRLCNFLIIFVILSIAEGWIKLAGVDEISIDKRSGC